MKNPTKTHNTLNEMENNEPTYSRSQEDRDVATAQFARIAAKERADDLIDLCFSIARAGAMR